MAAVETKTPKEEKSEMPLRMSLLSDRAIREHMKRGTVVIHPFHEANLSTSSYDVTLGRYYFRESPPDPGSCVYNPYSESMVRRFWGKPLEAERASVWVERTGTRLENISLDDFIIVLSPGETILGHTIEFIGGLKSVTSQMRARSSIGRNCLQVCHCAGGGDCNYINRWTMEITNNSRFWSIPLVVGRRIAQIVFFDTDGTDGSYVGSGKYQHTTDLKELMATWSPLMCLPKLYLDREIVRGTPTTPSYGHTPTMPSTIDIKEEPTSSLPESTT